MRRLRGIFAGVILALAFAAPGALADEAPETIAPRAEEPTSSDETAASQTEAPAPTPPVRQGDTLAAPTPAPAPAPKQDNGGGVTAKPEAKPAPQAENESEPEDGTNEAPVVPPSFSVPLLPSSCAPSGVPAVLVPIYQRAATAYGLGPQGASVLAAINGIETAFGTNLNISSAGAIGWMQFMPETWAGYGVDANGDGVADPYNPEDAIFAAASYLRAAGAPTDWFTAVFAYNHADWYVAEVLANAQCYGQLGGGAVSGAFELTPKLTVLSCDAAKPWRKRIPTEYLNAFEDAAARYDLGRRGVWALAAVARLESDFGRGMAKSDLHRHGALGLIGSEWKSYAVDGDGDGRIRHGDPADSAATLARMIWSQGDLRAGLFEHNHAKWYVDAVLNEAGRIEGKCKASTIDWALSLPNAVIAPINWENLTLSNELEKADLDSGAIDPRIVGLLGAITQSHQITISALRSDHSEYTTEGNVSNHYYGRAMDVAAVDGISCTDTAPTAPCGELATTLSQLPAPAMPTELIYCYDVDGPGPAFARSDHCDHVHVGYDG
jgi:Transglycosylase SLT domain